MLALTILLGVLVVALFIISFYLGNDRKKENKIVEEKNKEIEQKNKELEERYAEIRELLLTEETKIQGLEKDKERLKKDINASMSQITNSQEIASAAFEKYHDSLESRYKEVEREYDELNERLCSAYENLQNVLALDFNDQKEACEQEIAKLQLLLEEKKAVLNALAESEYRKEYEKNKSIVISEKEKNVIKIMKEQIEPLLVEAKDARTLRMLIWKVYYEKKINEMCRDFKGVSGVYKITNLRNGLCYVGQAVEVDKRIKEHVKQGLGIDTEPNKKLYQAMLEEGPENFSYELLLLCADKKELDAREAEFIELYNAVDCGYNSKAGNKTTKR